MAGRKKTSYKLTLKNFENADAGTFESLECCAFVEYSGLDDISTVEDAIAIRRLANGGDIPEFDDFCQNAGADTDGMVLVTTVSGQANKYPLLRAAGFTEFASFERTSPTRTIKLWGARVLGRGKFVSPKEEEYEEVKI